MKFEDKCDFVRKVKKEIGCAIPSWDIVSGINSDNRELANTFYNVVKKYSVGVVADFYCVSEYEIQDLYNKCSYWKPIHPTN